MTTKHAAFADGLRLAHSNLLWDLHKLEEAVRGTSTMTPGDLAIRLRATRADITAHFRFEEEGGYMNAVRKEAPHLERTIQHLAAEHLQFAQALDALIGRAIAATDTDEALRDGVRQWIACVRQHEAHENDLVQDAALLDIGAED